MSEVEIIVTEQNTAAFVVEVSDAVTAPEVVEVQPAPQVGDGHIHVTGEIPTGAVDGANAIFSSAFPFTPESLKVFVNGLRLKLVDDYFTTGNYTIHLATSPVVSDNVVIDYSKL